MDINASHENENDNASDNEYYAFDPKFTGF